MTFYNVIPLSLSTFLFVLFFGGGIKATILVLGVHILNIAIFSASLAFALGITHNLTQFSLKRILGLAVIGVVVTNLYNFLAEPLLFSRPPYSIPPLAYFFPPILYNFVTQFLLTGTITLLLVYWLFKRRGIKKLFIVCLTVAVINLPWFYLPSFQKEIKKTPLEKNLSPRSLSEIEKQISTQSKVEFLSENITPVTYRSASLQVRTKVTVPLAGDYSLGIDTSHKPPPNRGHKGLPRNKILFNGKELSSIFFQAGTNNLTIEFQDVFSPSGHLSDADTKRMVQGEEPTEMNLYGPYEIKLSLVSFALTNIEKVSLKNLSFTYLTKEYTPDNLPPEVLDQPTED